ncbi:hypothetical protein AB4480_08125 [Vibrio sp. 10N.261.45.A4]|uniref:hypothetical protein n=1 Tax=Vibrio sp. 10N.261.45.A4 TaxID=3229655 RepID=UPI003551DA30
MKKKLYQLVAALAIASVILPAAAKVTLDDVYKADAPKRARDLANNAAHIARHSSPLYPKRTDSSSSGGEVISKSGYCESGAYSSYNVCVLADTTYSCFLSGVKKSTDESVAEIIRASGVWKLKVTNEGGRNWSEKQGFSWTCTKPS